LWDELLSVLATHRVPCFLDFGQDTTQGCPSTQDVDYVRQLALAHPDLPMVLSHVMGGLGVHPAIIPLMHQVSNLYLDTTGILEFWREVARDIGPERVLFATGAPFTDPGILVSCVQYARGLNADAKRMIYGDNLRTLLERVL
jgi:predicted TIM-barrel fold metal-dependent hydrolase